MTATPVSNPPQMRFLTEEQALHVAKEYGTPAYVYDMRTLRDSAAAALAFPNAYGLTARYAMKAAPNAAILQLFSNMGLHFDCSSGYEVQRAILAGISPGKLSLSTQELPSNFADLLELGIGVNACSLSQLERIGKKFPGREVGVRFNPGLGSGGTGKTNVGGPSSSFGIWHELAPQVKEIAAKYDLRITLIHTHIGSGSDPEVWLRVSTMSLDLVRQFPLVHTLNLGGGYKVARMEYEQATDLNVVGAPVKVAFEKFAQEDGRQLKLEIEPGTFLVANACSLVTTVQDMTVTFGDEGHDFLKLDSGMTELVRPSLYGSQHPISIVRQPDTGAEGKEDKAYVVVGHCCESGDLVSCAPDEPETLAERELGPVSIGDLCVIDGVGAYCSGMSTKNYNSFPEAPEVLLDAIGHSHLIRKKQGVEQIIENEVAVPESLLK